ncbi:hypothetical protein CIHG_01671 [Coccidioides immitis H538.4]|uniref:Uncharacterized protein n=3 Tax=Coccidioides immitis TaxID=5501 RepID=A0A0J8R9J5_COCIT|nr:hypothetical protein CIRG_06000 [Coccidioides immitis RMSCC 2394]KMU80478.1 hypothetical protein CISG_02329 [Coccidioides immitis RMSCC 3703]KMU83887.1 hypothetical protein CIHG_01671 [Coccidioides immitis H538.4]
MINLARIIFSTKVDRLISRSHETLSTGQSISDALEQPKLSTQAKHQQISSTLRKKFCAGPRVHRHNPPGAKLLPNQEGQQVSVSEPECRGAKSSDAGWAARWASEGNRSPAADRRISTFGQTSD